MVDFYTDDGKNVILNRAYKSTPDYTAPSIARLGQNNTNVTTSSTSLDLEIPVENGTVLDNGSNNLTGGSGGLNSTDNTTTFKIGAGETDNTAQNLIKNDTNAQATWTISDLSSAGTNATADQYTGLWFYILDSNALDKFKTTGTALEIKLGSDGSNYYSKTYEATDLSTGWNWLPLGILNTLTETGTVSGDIDYFEIFIETNNATDEFIAGDIVYDLLRQWEDSDLQLSLSSGYPLFSEPSLNVTLKYLLSAAKGNGFLVDGLSVENTDTTPKIITIHTFNNESKSDTDEFEFDEINGW
ncbi:MAG: hypothetical protein ACOCUD_03680 [Bacillota bacterium]